MDAKAKLKQQLQAKRLKRGGPQAQRTFLEKQKVPEELIDSCMNRMQKGGSNHIQSLMNQLKQMTAAVTAASANASATASSTASVNASVATSATASSTASVTTSDSATAFADAVAYTIPDTPNPSPIVTNTDPEPATELKLD